MKVYRKVYEVYRKVYENVSEYMKVYRKVYAECMKVYKLECKYWCLRDNDGEITRLLEM